MARYRFQLIAIHSKDANDANDANDALASLATFIRNNTKSTLAKALE